MVRQEKRICKELKIKKDTYWRKPHHFKNPNCQRKIHNQDDQQQKNKQVEATLSPAINSNFVDVLILWPLQASAWCCCSVLFTYHLLCKKKKKETAQLLELNYVYKKQGKYEDIVTIATYQKPETVTKFQLESIFICSH